MPWVCCGLASMTPAGTAATWLSVAVLDDGGRLSEVFAISDNAAGYDKLSALLARHSAGQALIAVAADRSDHLAVRLMATTGVPLAFPQGFPIEELTEQYVDP